MNLLEVVSDGFADVKAHAGRTILQTIGVVLGVASVVATMGMTAGGREQSLRYYAESGGVLKVIVWSKPAETVRASAKALASRGLTLDDVEAVRAGIPGFALVEPEITRQLLVRTPRLSRAHRISGVSPTYQELHELIVDHGRFISADDITSNAGLCVLGADRAREFFGTQDPVGRGIRIGDHYYRVAGVLRYREFYWNKTESFNALGWMNELIALPATTMLARQVGSGFRRVDQIGLRLRSVEAMKDAVPALRRLLANRHGVDDFQVYARQERMQEMEQQGQVYDITFEVCGLISLLVGGIVVANIMLASFRERMREVGVRKALGAKGWHIAVQILMEVAIVSGLGGVVGLVLGVGLVNIIAVLLDQPVALTPTMVLGALACSTFVAAAFGPYPAWKAARLDPVVALRYE